MGTKYQVRAIRCGTLQTARILNFSEGTLGDTGPSYSQSIYLILIPVTTIDASCAASSSGYSYCLSFENGEVLSRSNGGIVPKSKRAALTLESAVSPGDTLGTELRQSLKPKMRIENQQKREPCFFGTRKLFPHPRPLLVPSLVGRTTKAGLFSRIALGCLGIVIRSLGTRAKSTLGNIYIILTADVKLLWSSGMTVPLHLCNRYWS